MRELSLEYGKALEEQLQIIKESTITEDTLNEEMIHASQTHRDRIKEMRAIPLGVEQVLFLFEFLVKKVRQGAKNGHKARNW